MSTILEFQNVKTQMNIFKKIIFLFPSIKELKLIVPASKLAFLIANSIERTSAH